MSLYFLRFNITHKKLSGFGNIFLLLATISICVATGEVALRLLKIEERLMKPKSNHESIAIRDFKSEEFHHNLIPNINAMIYPDLEGLPPLSFQVNSEGIRGREIRQKPRDGFRVLLLGDSFLEARLVKYENTMGQVLEKKIANDRADVIQHGVSSWSPLLELNWYLKVGRLFKPDVVILFLVANDFYGDDVHPTNDAAYQKTCILDKNGLPVGFNIEAKATPSNKVFRENEQSEFIKFMKDKSKIFLLINSFWKKSTEKRFTQSELDVLMSAPALKANQMMEMQFKGTREEMKKIEIIKLARPYKLWDRKTKKVVDDALRNVRKLKDVVEREGSELMVALVPFGWSFKDENIGGKIAYQFAKSLSIPTGGIENISKEWAKKNHIKYIDLYQEIKQYKSKSREKIYFDLDGHWNDKGHEVIADIIYKNIYMRFSG